MFGLITQIQNMYKNLENGESNDNTMYLTYIYIYIASSIENKVGVSI